MKPPIGGATEGEAAEEDISAMFKESLARLSKKELAVLLAVVVLLNRQSIGYCAEP